MRTKHFWLALLAPLTALCLLFSVLFLQGGRAVSAQASPSKVHVETVQNFHSISGYYLDVNLAGMDGSVTPQTGDAFVLRIDNKNTSATTIFSFKLNGTIMAGTSSVPTSIYTYRDEAYVASYSCGSYASGYVPGGEYTYLVIPASNFSAPGAVSTFSVSHRCAGAGAERNKNLNYDLYGLYLVSGYTEEGTLDTSSLQPLWTPAEDNFSVTVQNNSYTGSDYVTAVYTPAYAFSATADAGEGGNVTLDKYVFNEGDDVVITVAPNAGYALASLTVNGADVTSSVSEGKYTAQGLASDLTVYAMFRLTYDYKATVNAGEGGNVTLDKYSFNEGDDVVITVAPNAGYELVSLIVNDSDVTESVGSNRYTAENLTGDLTVTAVFGVHYDYTAAATQAEGGTVSFSATRFNVGDSVLVTVKPDAGYELASLTVNGSDVTGAVNNNRYTAKNLTGNLTASASFRLAATYYVEDGAITSIYNTRMGTAFAAWDSVNVMTVADMSSYPSSGNYQYVGITTSQIDAQVTSSDYIAVRVYNLDANWRTFYVMVNGGLNSSSGNYYMVDRFGNVTQKTGTGIITEKYTRFENATFELANSAATEGFSGLLVVPLANYGGGKIETIENVTVYSGARDKSNARFNVGAMWVLSEFDGMSAPVLSEEEAVWTPAQDNWSLYGDTAQFAQAQFLAEDDYAIRNVTVSPYYDTYYMTLPQNMIGADGYVDLAALGIKGIAIDVENFNATQTGFAIRLAGSDNTNLTNTGSTLWQTSISGSYTMKVIYDSGLVRVRAPAYLPYDESGSFSGTVYISLSNQSFTNIGGEGSFPQKIQPVMRLLFSRQDSDDSVYRANISNIRFITDETPFETGQITMTGIGGVIAGDIGGKAVGANSNNNVLYGTPVTFTVTPDEGYALEYVTYTMNDVTQTAVLDENNSFTVEVTGDVMVLFNCNEVAYAITYDLGGGTNNANNRTAYYLSDGTVRLYNPTREGYVFKGWRTEDGEIVTELDASAARNITLTAVWEAENAGGLQTGAIVGIVIAAVVAVGGAVAAIVLLRRKKRNG